MFSVGDRVSFLGLIGFVALIDKEVVWVKFDDSELNFDLEGNLLNKEMYNPGNLKLFRL